MSYILDALKKSEAERHQGKVPEFGQQQQLIFRKKQRPNYAAFTAGALVVINLLAIILWFAWQGGLFGQQRSGRVDALLSGSLSGPANSLTEPVQPVIQPPPPVSVPSQTTAKTAGKKTAESPPTGSVRVQEQSPRPAGDISSRPDNRVQNRDRADRQRKNESRPLQGANNPVSTKSEAKGKSAKTAPADPLQAEQEDVAHLSSFPASFRRRVPDLVFNSHIYSDDRSASRVMINNAYLKTGDSLSNLKLEAITRDGVIFSMDGRKFRVGVLGAWSESDGSNDS
ncbi:MAG: hypothetical protein CSB48_11555 [Proteobacteria bacterium]|nr:MAG: hypothetical protein CSB48_11555 [Pseudomonadota bacterium]PIE40109.1 MAG: hypothetical protein CSA51_02410 [Gammaproteobacteria bacterium]